MTRAPVDRSDIGVGAANPRRSPIQPAARRILAFWFNETPSWRWFRGGRDFDAEIARRFAPLHAAAAAGRLEHWRSTAEGALALVLIMDQFSRNLYRNDRRAFAADEAARIVASDALARRRDFAFRAPTPRAFLYMPFMHSENDADQSWSIRLFKTRLSGEWDIRHAYEHARIIAQFGRFPHRNAALGRPSTRAEKLFLKRGGFRG